MASLPRRLTPVAPLSAQTVLATIHRFPSLEPLRFEAYPASHLHLPTRRDILHRAVVYEGDGTRLGTASTKTRHEIRGSARKVRPQKGTGHARLGDKKSPMLKGGGVAFGPRPRDFSTALQKKVYDLAWRTALSYRYRKGELIIVDNAIELESPSPRLLDDVFTLHDKQRGRGRSLFVTLEPRPMMDQALRAMGRDGQALPWDRVDVKDLLELSRIVIERDALHNMLLAHQEDLTHKPVHPRHPAFVRSSPPAALESTVGWPEFRRLMLTHAAERDAARARAYETVAADRYTHAESLPEGPQRTELTVSAYDLLAEARQLQFTARTGFDFREYLRRGNDDETIALFPRIQALDYQIHIKSGLATSAAETSRAKYEDLNLEIRELEIQKLDIMADAALLAAQVHEHVAESHTLAGNEASVEETLAMASAERSNVDAMDLQLLEGKLEVARQQGVVAGLKGDYVTQRAAQKSVAEYNAMVETKRKETEEWETTDAEQVEEDAMEEPVVEKKSTNT
ncbi:ribosomal protein L4 [Dothidotthia symphoricarpi CBS 119687]|uniref:Large ribosomal subunit protein uL4m n=1 Tax=Dothidotthia symphoricarpi CBS 119687 TaxID=1392245 RepID=A0A6A6A883_9PLEO|nr:ribosomal protein L4 [Dothidotthia symphoricarpi CBS 119687]KAF2127018.1 ribosomal protein L4 [Dothidotthia symphoricarpi CBS 119687]